VLGADVFVVEFLGFLARQAENFACPLGELLKHSRLYSTSPIRLPKPTKVSVPK
jgi:hypothetical protein